MKPTSFQNYLQGIKDFSHTISNAVNVLLLLPVYFLGVGLTAIIAKIKGKHFLDRKLTLEKSYWLDLHLKKKSLETYFRQF